MLCVLNPDFQWGKDMNVQVYNFELQPTINLQGTLGDGKATRVAVCHAVSHTAMCLHRHVPFINAVDWRDATTGASENTSGTHNCLPCPVLYCPPCSISTVLGLHSGVPQTENSPLP